MELAILGELLIILVALLIAEIAHRKNKLTTK